uniref:Secreted protein n=1 Tax=Ascaris lumbricoides TaxID=6252 RepID=A0A0M3IXB3_ASCLU
MPSLSHTAQYSSGNLSSRSTIDPFAPFSDYDFEFNGNTFNATLQLSTSSKSAKPSLPAVGPSVSSMPSLSHTAQYSSGNLSSRSTIDPFAPFSDYDFEFNGNTFNATLQLSTSSKSGFI